MRFPTHSSSLIRVLRHTALLGFAMLLSAGVLPASAVANPTSPGGWAQSDAKSPETQEVRYQTRWHNGRRRYVTDVYHWIPSQGGWVYRYTMG